MNLKCINIACCGGDIEGIFFQDEIFRVYSEHIKRVSFFLKLKEQREIGLLFFRTYWDFFFFFVAVVHECFQSKKVQSAHSESPPLSIKPTSE